MDTLSNLAKQVELLTAQLELFRSQFMLPVPLRSEAFGARGGDQLLCSSDGFGGVVAALMDPAGIVVHATFGDYATVGGAAPVEVIIQPDPILARRLVSEYPGKLVANARPELFLRSLAGRSVDRIVIRDEDSAGELTDSAPWSRSIVSSLSAGARASLREALRVARRQIVLLVRPDRKGASQRSGPAGYCAPADGDAVAGLDSGKTIIVGNIGDGFDPEPIVQEYAMIVNCAGRVIPTLRVVVLSRCAPNLRLSENDVVVCDLDVAESQFDAQRGPARNVIVVPLKLLRGVLSLPPQVLRSSIMNFAFLEGYLEAIPDVLPVGSDAEVVVDHLRSRIAQPQHHP